MHDDQNDEIFVPVDASQLQSIVILLEGPNDRREDSGSISQHSYGIGYSSEDR